MSNTSKYAKYFELQFEDRGRGPRYDCWGLVRLILSEQFGVEVPSYANDYSSSFTRLSVAPLIEKEALDWQQVAIPKEGDIVLLRIGGRPWHCGLMIAPDRFLHIEREHGVLCESIHSGAWSKRISAFVRHRSLIEKLRDATREER